MTRPQHTLDYRRINIFIIVIPYTHFTAIPAPGKFCNLLIWPLRLGGNATTWSSAVSQNPLRKGKERDGGREAGNVCLINLYILLGSLNVFLRK